MVVLSLVAGTSAAVALLTFAAHRPGNADDAFILMVYVRNLLEHGTIEWNVGEGPIDGCTSMLDLLVKAAAARLSGAGIFEASLGTTFAFVVLGSWVAFGVGCWAGTRPTERLALGLAAALLIASAHPNGDSASYRLEGPLFVTCSLAFIGTATTRGAFSRVRLVWLILCGWLVVLARPEGLALASGVILATCYRERGRLGARAGAAAAGVFAIGVLAYLAWRISYFGYWAPNTYYAKTSAIRWNEIRDGWSYLVAYASTALGAIEILPVVIAPAALLHGSWSSTNGRWCFGVSAVAGLCMLGAVIWSGGDIYPGGRLLNLPVSLGLLSLVLGAAHAAGTLRRLFLGGIVGVGLVQAGHSLANPSASFAYLVAVRDEPGVKECDRLIAARLRRAQVAVGQTDFQRLKFIVPTIRVIDFSGLNDREIAHQEIREPVGMGKFTIEAVVRRRPEVFVWGYGFWSGEPVTQYSMKEIVADPELAASLVGTPEVKQTLPRFGPVLAAAYVPASSGICRRVTGFFNLLVRRDVAPRLAEVGFVIGR